MGGSNPIRIQSMTNTATQDTEASVAQAKLIVNAGGEYVRLTAQGIKEAENLMNINAGLRREDRKSTRLNSSHRLESRMPSSA